VMQKIRGRSLKAGVPDLGDTEFFRPDPRAGEPEASGPSAPNNG